MLHADYREWCAHCVAGKGISHQHRAVDKDQDVAEFGIDYAFMTADGVVRHEEDIEESKMSGATPVIIGHDRQSKGIWAMVVDHKGAQESSVRWLKNKIKESGHSGTKVTVKSDQEVAIVALKKAVAIKRQAETVLIESPVRDSRANGTIERAMRTWAAQTRTMRHHLESRLKAKVPKESPLMTWLATWAAEVLFRYKSQSNG